MKNRIWALAFAALAAALLLCWKLLPAESGTTAGIYQNGTLLETITLPHTGSARTFTVSGVAGGNTIEV